MAPERVDLGDVDAFGEEGAADPSYLDLSRDPSEVIEEAQRNRS